jgi:hypothetical protein
MNRIIIPPKQIKYSNTKCTRFSHLDENGEQVYKPKKRFETDKEAIAEAKRKNSLPETIHKYVAYKCKTCCKWHIGKTMKLIENV